MRSHCELTTSPNIDGISVCRETRSRIGSKQSANCAKKLAENPPNGCRPLDVRRREAPSTSALWAFSPSALEKLFSCLAVRVLYLP